MDAALIVGLGNPGRAYAHTRHNTGAMVVEELCKRHRLRLRPGAGAYDLARTAIGMTALHLLITSTYMNLSGPSVADALEELGLSADRTLIVLDDFQLPLGLLRLRPGGSDGGHNGLASVLQSLGTEAVPRLRCGIGTETMPPSEGRRKFVLEPFA
ncbi:MAG TPA: aminoacyl-tRNA hydrolase, partial [Bacteroidota bacterium]|nr:aminoacyl-tRNA hydrolase [Bacteroidota bacterium]